MRFYTECCSLMLVLLSFGNPDKTTVATALAAPVKKVVTKSNRFKTTAGVLTGDTSPADLITFARSLTGINYRYGSTNPLRGFDCSGFVNYVFNHFDIAVPRSSGDFLSAGKVIELKDAKPGDLILFTGTGTGKRHKRHSRSIGHIGIMLSSIAEGFKFIHSTSGAANGVTETELNDYYMGRFMKIIRVFPQNDETPAPPATDLSSL
jgi:lipoprotein Spr